MNLKINNDISLALLDDEHAEALFQLVNNNRNYLGEWLPWVEKMQTVEDFKNFIAASKDRFNKKTEIAYIILYKNKLAGRLGLYHFDHQNKIASIGYWLGKEFAGNGIVTTACKALINYGFAELNLNRIEIKCGTENYRSQAIPQKLNFTKEGIIRQGEYITKGFIDLYLFSILKDEWKDK